MPDSPAPVRVLDEPNEATGLGLNLGYADENVIGYDHPQVLVFRNADRLTASEIRSRIDDASALREETPPLMLAPEALEAQQGGGTWSEVFRRDGWPNRVPWLSWLLVLEIICLVAFPLTWWLLRPLHDRGLLFSRGSRVASGGVGSVDAGQHRRRPVFDGQHRIGHVDCGDTVGCGTGATLAGNGRLAA